MLKTSAKTPKKVSNENKNKSKSKNKTNKTTRSKTSSNFFNKEKKIKENELALEDTSKYYQKYYEAPNSLFTSQLKTNSIKIFLNSYKLNDILVMCRIFSKYKYFKSMVLAPSDPSKKNSKVVRRNPREPITEGEKLKISRQNKDAEVERINMINRITSGIGRQLAISSELSELTINNFDIDRKFAQNISMGITKNSSLETLNVNSCTMKIDAYEILLKGLLNHIKIGTLNLKNNNLDDKFGNMIGRIIARQTYRRDQIIWLFSLRNEIPKNNDHTIGLISLDLSRNQLSSYSADCITTALASDQYVRSIILTYNKFDQESCKKFIYMLRKNMALLNIDLRFNPGYDDNIKKRLVMKMSKNIRYLSLQYKKGVYTEEEYKNLKKYINPSFFNDNIPKEIVQYYNNNLHSNMINNIININTETSNEKSNDKNKSNSNSNKVKSDTQKNKKEHSYSNVNKNSPSLLNSNSNKKKRNNIKNVIKEESGNTLNKDSDKLLQENLILKRIILELKARNIQKEYGKKLNIPKNYNANNLNKNYQKANKLFDDLEEIMYTIGNDKKEDDSKNNNNKNDNSANDKKVNELKEEKKIDKNNIINNSKPKEDKKVIDKENKIINKNNNKINNNIDLVINDNDNDKEDNKEVMKKKENGQKFNNLNIYDDENDEEDEIEDNDLIFDNPEHQQIYESLKQNYESRGLKFGKKEFMELILKAQQEKLEGGEGDDDDDDEPF